VNKRSDRGPGRDLDIDYGDVQLHEGIQARVDCIETGEEIQDSRKMGAF